MRLPRQFYWENDSFLKFKNTLCTEPIQILIRNYLERDDGDVNTSLTDSVNILTATSKLCLKIRKKPRKRIKKASNKKWFDGECRLKRHEVRKLSNQKHRDPLNSEIREKFHQTLNEYKNLLDLKKKNFQKEKTKELDEISSNPDKSLFWSCLKSIDDTIPNKNPPSIPEDKWLEHFQYLHSEEPKPSTHQEKIYNELQQLEKEKD